MAIQAGKTIAEDEYDLYLVRPQRKMYYQSLGELAKKADKAIVNNPPQADVPISMGTEKLAK